MVGNLTVVAAMVIIAHLSHPTKSPLVEAATVAVLTQIDVRQSTIHTMLSERDGIGHSSHECEWPVKELSSCLVDIPHPSLSIKAQHGYQGRC